MEMTKAKALSIRSTAAGGHRRAGRRWAKEPAHVAVSELGKKQLAAIGADPRLVVKETEIDAPEPRKGDGEGDGKAGGKAGGKGTGAAAKS